MKHDTHCYTAPVTPKLFQYIVWPAQISYPLPRLHYQISSGKRSESVDTENDEGPIRTHCRGTLLTEWCTPSVCSHPRRPIAEGPYFRWESPERH